jgi:hydrogenase maturation protease
MPLGPRSSASDGPAAPPFAPFFIGVGNALRRDDGVGPWLAAQLAARGWPSVAHQGDGAGLIELFRGRPDVVLLDAMQSGAAPGTTRRLDAAEGPIAPALFRRSTHLFGLAEAVETARALGWLPARLIVYGIEGADFTPGSGLSSAVAAAASDLLEALAPA